jgi:pimeloyl-ACP methyl ester carboxylesterase
MRFSVPLLVLAACRSPDAPPPAHPMLTDGVVDVAGRSFHVHCEGTGAPTVVFDAGRGGSGRVWKFVVPEVRSLTRACVYDRLGNGYSAPAPPRHTSREMAEELHAVLAAAHLPGPFVLVGHSLGGLNIRMFVSAHPSDVAGMVFVDAPTDDMQKALWAILTPEQVQWYEAAMARRGVEAYDLTAFRKSIAELHDAKRPLGDLPIVVLSRGRPYARDEVAPGATEEQARASDRVHQESEAALARESTNSALVIARESGHDIHFEQPKLVAESVREVVEAARLHAPVDAARLAAFAGVARVGP